MKLSALHGAILALCGACLAVSPVWAEGYGPEQVVIQSTIDKEKVPRPAYLAHHTHQWLDCDGCHHSKGPDGRKVNWVPGQKVERCATCHNTTTNMQQRLAKVKFAGHRLCMECHLQNDKDLARCGVCHNKK
ncbi:MAG: cytochrome c3 family protein [Desulfobulbus sp.]|nr:cytochrome c3 family protein [Desulfobulbus sp.]